MKLIIIITSLFILTSCCNQSIEHCNIHKDFDKHLKDNEIADENIITSINEFIDSLNSCKNNDNKYYNLSKSHNTLGLCHYTLCNYNEAIKEYVKALRYYDKIKNNHKPINHKGEIYKNLADIFYDCENHILAKDTYFKSLEHCIMASDSTNIVYIYRKIGNLCYYLSEYENPDTLLYYMQKSMNYTLDEEPLISALYMALTSAFHQQEKLSSFFPYRAKGFPLLPNNKESMTYSMYNYLSTLYQIEGNIDEAIKYSNMALKSNDIRKRIPAHKQLSNLYLIKGDSITSFSHSIKHDSLNDIFSEQKRKAFGAENIFHDYEEEQQKTFNKKRNNHTKLLVLFFIISATSIFIIIKRKASSSKNKFAEKWSIFEASDIIGLIKHKCESESDLNANNVSTSMIYLTDDEKRNLEEEINICFDKFTYKIKNKFPDLNKGEIEYCMLSLLNISEIHKAALLGLSYQGCVSRKKRVIEKTKMNNINKDLLSLLKNITTT